MRDGYVFWIFLNLRCVRFAAFAVREKCKAGAFIFPYRSPRSGPEPVRAQRRQTRQEGVDGLTLFSTFHRLE
jgi:hypothetical protein